VTEAEPAIKTFLTLYYGGVHIVSDETVNRAKALFKDELFEYMAGPKNRPPPDTLRSQGSNLINAYRKSLSIEDVYGLTVDPSPQPDATVQPRQ